MRALALLTPLALSGCHIIAGFDGLEYREDSEVVWSKRYGDELPQRLDDVAATPEGFTRVLGSFEGEIDLGLGPVAPGSQFVAQLDPNGAALWSEALDPRIVPRSLVPGTERIVITNAEVTSLLGTAIVAPLGHRNALAVAHIARDGMSATVKPVAAAGDIVSAVAAELSGGAGLVVGGTVIGEVAPTTFAACGEVGDPAASDENAFVGVWLDGECAWLASLGDLQPQWLDAVGADGGGNLVFAGRLQGTMELTPDTVLEGSGGTDLFVVKLAADDQAPLWARRFGDTDRTQSPVELVVRDTGTITLAGYFEGDIDFGTGTLSTTQGSDIFVAKLDPGGNTIWTRQFAMRNDPFEGVAEQKLTRVSLAVDGQGNTLLAGHYRGEVDFGGTTRASNGELDMFLVKLDVDGELLWSGSFGDGELQCLWDDCATALAIDRDQFVILGGGFHATMDLGNGEIGSAGDSDAFLAKFTP
jgi:hypothetical protein